MILISTTHPPHLDSAVQRFDYLFDLFSPLSFRPGFVYFLFLKENETGLI